MRFFITGTAGFIGFHVAKRLTDAGHAVCGVDGMTTYYDVALKRRRHAMLLQSPHFSAHELMLEDMAGLSRVYEQFKPDIVIHLAAQAGVRYSLAHPYAYLRSNLDAFLNVLEGCRAQPVEHLVYASSSSVYGLHAEAPFSEAQRVDRPLSLYAATKAANELMAHSYAHLYRIPCTALRFFTVYGPWGRPDMAPILFSRAILAGRPIEVFNEGRMRRDFTYIDEIVAGVLAALERVPRGADGEPPHRVYNLGNHRTVELERFIGAIEGAAGRKAVRIMKPMQPGDMVETMADTSLAERDLGFAPTTTIEQGVPALVDWCRSYYGNAA